MSVPATSALRKATAGSWSRLGSIADRGCSGLLEKPRSALNVLSLLDAQLNVHPIRLRYDISFSIGAPETAINVTSRAFRCGIRLSNESAIELFTGHPDS